MLVCPPASLNIGFAISLSNGATAWCFIRTPRERGVTAIFQPFANLGAPQRHGYKYQGIQQRLPLQVHSWRTNNNLLPRARWFLSIVSTSTPEYISVMLPLRGTTIIFFSLAAARVVPRTSSPQQHAVLNGTLDSELLEPRCNQPGGTWICVSPNFSEAHLCLVKPLEISHELSFLISDNSVATKGPVTIRRLAVMMVLAVLSSGLVAERDSRTHDEISLALRQQSKKNRSAEHRFCTRRRASSVLLIPTICLYVRCVN